MITFDVRRLAVGLACAAATFVAASAGAQGLPAMKQKETYKVGFAQTESNNPWRIAQTESMKAEAAKRGWQLVYTDAAGSAAKQVADVDSMIAQGVDLIFLAPREEKPLVPAVMKAKRAGIPVILLDRTVDESVAKAGRDYVTFIGSDFVEEGRRAAQWLVKATNGNARIIQLEGTAGSSPANDRRKGFEEVIAKNPGMKIVASQSGDFVRDKGRQVTETLLQAHPDATAIYAHNDEMVIGAIAAVEAAGRTPGKDIRLVSIDGTRDALQAIIDGKLGATVECSPRFGPKAFDTALRYAKGEKIEPKIINEDQFFDASNAAAKIGEAF
ncbi:ABC transporter substrate-binding protein [Azospirillum thermophilum]|uniref:Sugar ABC transporter substrate-binding protein n=1 Tax=Azospirillum thermophilum TaxID=2202148 RepID=A0A2S2CYG7_9PROT|nr:ABC transporter substrate-binding protein [Azospirillum thermophilum]AWK89450.1 sugar ABC transporter substrate-binding protein [Azospirillum thermophilum]